MGSSGTGRLVGDDRVLRAALQAAPGQSPSCRLPGDGCWNACAGGAGCARGLLYVHFSTAASPKESGGEQLRGPVGAMPWLQSSAVLFPSSHATFKFA